VGIVWPCALSVEEYATAGRSVVVPRQRCPACRGQLIFWSGYSRFTRCAGTTLRLWVRRAKCRSCSVTHALLPLFLLRRRLDPATVVGGAVARMVAGHGARSVAAAVGVPHTTARDWRRRHRARAPAWLIRAEALIAELGDELPRWSVDLEQASLDALVVAWRSATGRAANVPLSVWQFVSAISGGSWLSTTTSAPWASLVGRSFIAATPSTAL
jgi:hypothetical protein